MLKRPSESLKHGYLLQRKKEYAEKEGNKAWGEREAEKGVLKVARKHTSTSAERANDKRETRGNAKKACDTLKGGNKTERRSRWCNAESKLIKRKIKERNNEKKKKDSRWKSSCKAGSN